MSSARARRERLLAPGIPVDRVAHVLAQVGAGLVREAVRRSVAASAHARRRRVADRRVPLSSRRPCTKSTLRPGRDRSARRRHPWLLSGAVAREPGEAAAGERRARAVRRGRGARPRRLRAALADPRAPARVRQGGAGAGLDGRRALAAAAARRASRSRARRHRRGAARERGGRRPAGPRRRPLRGRRGACASRPRAMAARRERARGAALAEAARRARGRGARRRGGGAPRRLRAGRRGRSWGDAARRRRVEIAEHGRRYRVDPLRGQKTGFYLDQRDARSRVEALAEGRRVLDLFALHRRLRARRPRAAAPRR